MTNNKIRHIPELDGLRGVAILLVISFHYFYGARIFSFGWSGVDLFFVLSGYLISSRLLVSIKEPDYFSRFYRNRILRIFPLYYFVLIVFFICILWLPALRSIQGMDYYIIHWKSFFLFTDNWTYIFYGFPRSGSLTHFWSLAVEEQFYLVWPLALYFIARSKKRYLILMIAVLLVIMIRSIIHSRYPDWGDMQHYYYNSFCRMDSLIIGSLLAFFHIEKIAVPKRLALAVLCFSAAIIAAGVYFTGSAWASTIFFATIGYTVIAVFCASVLHLSVQPDPSILRSVLNNSLLRRFGKISFGLYVYHLPVLLIIRSLGINWNIFHSSSPGYGTVLQAGCCLLISWLISELSYRFLETYFLQLKK